ncbi:MAG: hypothetical protein JY451_02880 [Erythrobacter sp.]|nr:MAG: hypothetical protein JY451_02880 [Erythrobacter sp.]
MSRDVVTVLLFLGPLGACAGDNPDNRPQYGRWELVRTLDSVTIDGVAFAPDQLPASFREMEGTVSICGEPTYTDRAWQAEDVRERTKGMCELEIYSNTSTNASLEGSCTLSTADVEYTPLMRGNSTFDETSTRDVIVMEGSLAVEGDPAPHTLKAIAVQEGRRTGDC